MSRLILIMLIFTTYGCGSIIHGSRQSLEINTIPAGLVASINTKSCKTPCSLEGISRRDTRSLVITYNGEQKYYPLDWSFNFWSTIPGNIWNLIMYGLIVDVISGGAYTVEPVTIDLTLT